MRNKILITGGSGMVGHAVQHTEPCGIESKYLSSKDVDLRDFNACDEMFRSVQPTHVIHLAARVGGVKGNYTHMAEFFRDNILINTNVLECAKMHNANKLVSLLSCCIYPDGAPLPLQEKDLHNGEPHYTNYGYAYAKRMIEVQSRAYNQQYGTNFICLIPTNIFGKHDNFDIENGHVIPALIRKIHAAKLKNETAIIWGDGSALREFTYADDVALALWWALFNYDGEPINIGSNEEVSIKYLVECICESLDYYKIEWDISKLSGQARKPIDKSKFAQLTSLPSTSLKDGVSKTVAWYLDNFPNVRA